MTKTMNRTAKAKAAEPGAARPGRGDRVGVQLKLDSATDPRLAAFIAAYADATKAPEPRGEVTGGSGTPTG